MSKFSNICVFLLYSVCACAQALYNDSALYAAYTAEDMSVWKRYIESVDFADVSLREQERCLSYEFGYVAAAIDANTQDAQSSLCRFEDHIGLLTPVMPQATILAYRSALAAYKVKTGQSVVSNAFKAFRFANKAYDADSLNTTALTIRGNVLFFAPSIAGGNKRQALLCFRRAASIYEERGDTICSWEYAAIRMWINQCEEKIK